MILVFEAGKGPRFFFSCGFLAPAGVLTLSLRNSKTGVVLKDSGLRDEHGMQPLDDIFSSPDKESHNGADEEDYEEESDEEEPMDIDESKFSPGRK